MSIVIVATVVPKEVSRDEVVAAFERAVERVQAEDAGCELYALHEGRDRLVMIEKWADRESLKAHGASAAFAELTAALDGKLETALDVQVLRPHPAGTAELGTL
jgi:quinol monooxygenase YgiN